MKYSIVVPACNEEKNIPLVAEKISRVLNGLTNDWEIIFIDDGSKDKTYEEMKKARDKDNRIKLVRFKRNFGQSAAWQAGFDYATGDIIVSMDADLQNDPVDIPKMLSMIENENFDAVSGWREEREDNWFMTFLSKIGNWLRRVMTGDKIHDHGCSLKAYKKECIKDLEFYSDLHRRYITALLSWKGYRVGEMKTHHHARQYGKSKYSIRKKWKGLLDLLVVKFWIQYSTRPIHLFGTLGVAMAGFGLFLGAILTVLWYLQMISLQNRTSPLLAVLMIIIGIQLVMTGFIADTVAMNYYATRKAYTIEKVEGLDKEADENSVNK